MWQTLLNLLTFHRDFASEAVSGRLRPGTGRGRAAFWTDVVVTVLAAIPTAIIAVPARERRGAGAPRRRDRDRGGAAPGYGVSSQRQRGDLIRRRPRAGQPLQSRPHSRAPREPAGQRGGGVPQQGRR